MLCLCHWRLLEDSSILIFKFSEHEFDDLRPVDEGNIRAEVYPSGYLLTATTDGTKVKLLTHVSCIYRFGIGLIIR